MDFEEYLNQQGYSRPIMGKHFISRFVERVFGVRKKKHRKKILDNRNKEIYARALDILFNSERVEKFEQNLKDYLDKNYPNQTFFHYKNLIFVTSKKPNGILIVTCFLTDLKSWKKSLK